MHSCVCPAAEGVQHCPRHNIRKNAAWRELCQKRDDYFQAWEEGRGPGQGIVLVVAPSKPREPIGLSVWPAGESLAEMIRGASWPPGETAIDLGCGTGVVGLAALAAGLRVTFADSEPACIERAAENARAAGFTDFEVIRLDWRSDAAGSWDHVFGGDNASTWPPLVEWLDRAPCEVIRLPENRGPRAPLTVLTQIGDVGPVYCITDGDLDLSGVPLDFLNVLQGALDRYPGIGKVGLSLEIDDLPSGYPFPSENGSGFRPGTRIPTLPRWGVGTFFPPSR